MACGVEQDRLSALLPDGIPFARSGKTVVFKPDFLEICFTGVGIEGSRPAEKNNIGRYFPGSPVTLRKAEII